MFRRDASGKTAQVFLRLLGIFLFLVPLLLSLLWGAALSDGAYQVLGVAQNLGGDLAPAFGSQLLTQAPLYVGLLAVAGRFAPQVALVFGALGWSVTAVAVFAALRATGQPLAAVMTALLLALNPLIVLTAGTASSWVLALGWLAAALTVLPPPGERPGGVWIKTLLLFLLLGLHFTAATIIFALALLVIDVTRGRAGWLPFVLVAAAAFVWGFWAIPNFGNFEVIDLASWRQQGAALLINEQLLWLYVPFVVTGVWGLTVNSQQSTVNNQWPTVNSQQSTITDQLWSVGLMVFWAGTAVVARDSLAPLLAAFTGLLLAGFGAAWMAHKILAYGVLAEDEQRASRLVPALVVTPLLLLALVLLWQIGRGRSAAQEVLQEQAAAWLRENSEAEATLYALPRVGFLAGRPTMPALVDQITDATIDDVYDLLLGQAPDYVVSENSFAWDYVTRTTWFKDRYQARAQFENGYAPDAPVTIWGYTPTPFDDGEEESLVAVVDDRFALVGYQFEPRVIAPGDDVYLTLYLEALQRVDHGFVTGVHLSTPDGWVWAWREERTPRTLPGQWWEPGQVIPERIRLITTDDIPTGAYDLQVFWRAGDEKSNWPIVRDGDENVLDRIFLGFVVAPPAVDTTGATTADARFGETIRLDSFQYAEPVPGEPWEVTLFWEALERPAKDYTVFVHLLDGDGQIAASHDGMPLEDRFPTSAWRPGMIIPDKHTLALPADLAPGEYQFNTGLYLLETGERLPVWDSAGLEQVERSLPLAAVEVP
jgi:hypothetical protein